MGCECEKINAVMSLRCGVLPPLFVKCHSSLKEGNSQMLVLAYAAIKRLRNTRADSHFL